MDHWKTLALLLLHYLIWLAPQRSSAASLVHAFRILAQQVDNPKTEPIQEVSPSPGPEPEVNKSINKSNSGETKDDKNPAAAPETCEMVSNKCHDDLKNVTACVLPYAGHGVQWLLVLNDGDSSLKLNVTVLRTNLTYNDTEIPGHKVKKINVPSNAGRSSSIELSAVNWTCTIQIHTGVPVPSGYPSYAAYVTPINGAYVVFATAVLIGGMWACCRLGKNRRHLDGVPYRELEMGQQQSTSSINVETADGWDQSWDDDWDEEKAVKSPGGNYGGNRRANGISSTSADDTNGWGNDWDD